MERAPVSSSALARLVAEGRVLPPRLDLAELGPPPEPEQPLEMTISEALAEQREER